MRLRNGGGWLACVHTAIWIHGLSITRPVSSGAVLQSPTYRILPLDDSVLSEDEKAAGYHVAARPASAGASVHGVPGAEAGAAAGKLLRSEVAPSETGVQSQAQEHQEPSRSDQLGDAALLQLSAAADSAVGRVRCTDMPANWRDLTGDFCFTYDWGEFCTQRGGYGRFWQQLKGGNFSNFARDNITAVQACCACGGGFKFTTSTTTSTVLVASPTNSSVATTALTDTSSTSSIAATSTETTGPSTSGSASSSSR